MKQAIRPSILIAIMGVSGCGKTTLGKALALALNAKLRAGLPLTDLDREPWLERLNGELIACQLRSQAVILACSALKECHRTLISRQLESLQWVFLDGEFRKIAQRIRVRSATTAHYMPESLLRSQFEALERPSKAIRLDVELSTSQQVDELLAWLQ
jgi:gluconokinase